ncbi:hypothetical protein [Aneurinibacillus sp. UBA3580]|jgi:hypothetical protein|uniref:hypothetical protein n=1 Tax=Aneurinibacillus sp. UBA3580 TaxID=1946041 RepID=UPI0025801AB9|nr:hypothetical protein [Aneurinibacillus sp. UBA3580]
MFANSKAIQMIELLLLLSILVYTVAYIGGALYPTVYAAMAAFLLGIAGIALSLWKQRYLLAIADFLLVVGVFTHIMFFWNL